MAVDIAVLQTADCPNAEPTLRLVNEVADALDVPAALSRLVIETPQQALAHHFAGTPTVLVGGHDLELDVQPRAELLCRRYEGDERVPPRWLIEAALLRAIQPRSILFLCYANSVRSQMAEALARHLLPPSVQLQSAGSFSCDVHRFAIQVLDEIDVDTATLRSKCVDEIETEHVEAVITLCDEQTCPAYLGHARRLHWPIPDPSAVADALHALSAFRACRDEIARRIRLLAPRSSQKAPLQLEPA